MKKRIITYLFVGGMAVVAASPTLMDFLGRWEGQGQYIVYADKLAGGLPTVCKGITRHTSQYPIIVGERWSPEKCAAEEERIAIETQINLQRCVKVAVPQGVWDMLTSHAHNFGWPKTCGSQTVAAINVGRLAQGCNLLAIKPDGSPNWSHAGGQYVQGLNNRRQAERGECLAALN